MLVLGKFQDAYWLTCEPMRNKTKVAGNLAQLHCSVYRVYTNNALGTVGSRARILAQSMVLQLVAVRL